MPIDPPLLDRIISNDPALDAFDLSRQGLNDDDIILLVNALAKNDYIQSLDVSFNHIGSAGARVLAANTSLQSLNLCGNHIGAEGAIALAGNTNLRSLKLRGNGIGVKGVIALAGNTSLQSLNLR